MNDEEENEFQILFDNIEAKGFDEALSGWSWPEVKDEEFQRLLAHYKSSRTNIKEYLKTKNDEIQ